MSSQSSSPLPEEDADSADARIAAGTPTFEDLQQATQDGDASVEAMVTILRHHRTGQVFKLTASHRCGRGKGPMVELLKPPLAQALQDLLDFSIDPRVKLN